MLLQIPRVVSQDKLTVIRAILAKAKFVDGKLSAGMAAERVKNNEELASDTKEIQQLKKGECFYFSAEKEHWLHNTSSQSAVVLWISSPPYF